MPPLTLPLRDVAVIIPALNEQETVPHVIAVALQVTPEVVVVSDGSSDQTAAVSRQAGAYVVEFDENRGKGAALKAAADASRAKYLIMLDADLTGLQIDHLLTLASPVLNDKLDMCIGIFGGGGIMSDFGNRVTPQLSGQRACKREWLAAVPDLAQERWPEPAITRYLKETQIRWDYVTLPQLAQVFKEQKRGFWSGLKARAQMYVHLLRYELIRKRNVKHLQRPDKTNMNTKGER